MRMTLLNPATGELLRRRLNYPARHQFLFQVHREELNDVVLQPVGMFQFADRIVRRFEIEIHVGALPLPPDFVGELFAAPIFRLDELRTGLIGDGLHLLDKCIGLLIGDGRTNNEQRLVELHAAILLDKGPQTSWERGVGRPYGANGRWTVAQASRNCQFPKELGSSLNRDFPYIDTTPLHL